MPRIIVMADTPNDEQKPVMLTERVSVRDFESHHFQTQLVERLGWAVEDADAVEHDSDRHFAQDESFRPTRERELSVAQPVS